METKPINSKQQLSEREFNSLLKAAQAILDEHDFVNSSRVVFDEACAMTGAKAGYVALLTDDGTENEVLFLEAGDMPCTVDPNLPMPIRGLREVSYRTGKAAYDNDFMNSEWVKFLPEGHVELKNVMFSPLNIEGKTVGIIGLANKDSDFTDFDAMVAEAFGHVAAIGLKNARMLDKLDETNKQLEAFNEIMVERESRIIETKKEVNELYRELGKEPKYKEVEGM